MNPWAFYFMIVGSGTALALWGINVPAVAVRIRRAWLRRFPRWRVVGEPVFLSYAEADRLLSQGPVDGRVWRISSRLEDRNQMIGRVWLELVERVVL